MNVVIRRPTTDEITNDEVQEYVQDYLEAFRPDDHLDVQKINKYKGVYNVTLKRSKASPELILDKVTGLSDKKVQVLIKLSQHQSNNKWLLLEEQSWTKLKEEKANRVTKKKTYTKGPSDKQVQEIIEQSKTLNVSE